MIQLLRQIKIVFPCSGIRCLCFTLCEIIGFRHYFGDLYSFSKRQQHTFCFSIKKKSYERFIPLRYTFDQKSFDKFDFFISNLFKFETLLLYLYMIYEYSNNISIDHIFLMIYLQSWSNLLIVTNPRLFSR